MPHRASHPQLVAKVVAALSVTQALTSLRRKTAQHGLFHVNSVILWDTIAKWESNTSQTSSNAPSTTSKTGKTSSSHIATSFHQHGVNQRDHDHMAPICTIKFLSQTWNGIMLRTASQSNIPSLPPPFKCKLLRSPVHMVASTVHCHVHPNLDKLLQLLIQVPRLVLVDQLY